VRPWLASLVVFVTSGAVLVLEILAGRLLAPYVGVTLQTFTAIIGVVLAGIAIGTWLGGVLADRFDPRRLVAPSIVLGGALAILAVPVIRVLGSGQPSGPAAAVVLATLAFFLPSAVLSSTHPFVVKLQLRDLDATGHVVGRLSAIGTAGSLVGTFVTGFVLVAAFPTTPTIVVIGGSLVVGGLALWWHLGRPRDGGATLVSAGVAVAAIGLALVADGPCETETEYFCARVEVDDERSTGRTLWLDTLQHSYVDLDDPTYLRFSYVQLLGDLADTMAPPGEPLDVVHIGGGGFTFPRYVDATRPGSDNLVLELDDGIVELAQDQLGLRLSPSLRAVTGDARVNLRDVPDDSADLVVGDAFGGEAVPWHLTTVELTRDVQRVLRDDGIYAVNVIDHPPLGFARAEVATLAAVFEHVAVIGPADRVAGEVGGNLVLLASDAPLPLDALLAANRARGDDDVAVSGPDAIADWIGGADVLTDEHAPVDQLLTPQA
jgi:spermidine synthase